MTWAKHYKEAQDWPWFWPNFTPAEMSDRNTGETLIVPAFMDWLQQLRIRYGMPMIITSAYRTSAHQQLLPGNRITGSHVDAEAVDVKIYGGRAHRLLGLACELGVKGIGVHQTGDRHSRYLHLDMWNKAPADVRPMIWSY